VDDLRLGSAIRQVRRSRGWRQIDLARRSGASQATVSRVERGHIASLSVETVRNLGAALDIRVDVVPRWRGGDLDRLLNRRHSQLHASVAHAFRTRWPAWTLVPEASFSIYGERGVIDVLGWHPGRRSVLVIELKTQIVDLNELLGTLDRKRRLGRRVASDRGWDPLSVSAWLIVAGGRTNRRHVHDHADTIELALPDGRSRIERWLKDPVGAVAGWSFWPDIPGGTGRHATAAANRVRHARSSVKAR